MTTYFALDPFEAGDVACAVSGAPGQVFLKLAVPDVLDTAGAAIGIVRFDTEEGEAVTLLTRSGGAISRTITGLAAAPGLVRVGIDGRAELVTAYQAGDYPLGSANVSGSLTLDPRTALVPGALGNAVALQGVLIEDVEPEEGQVLGVVGGIYTPIDLPVVDYPVTGVDAGPQGTITRSVGAEPTDFTFEVGEEFFGRVLKCHGTNDQRDDLVALIVAANAAWAIDGIPRTVRVGRGVLRISAPVRILSGVLLRGTNTTVRPHSSWVPVIGDADRRDNNLFYGEGDLDTTLLNTTLTTSITPGGVTYYGAGNRKLGLTSLGNLVVGSYFVVGGHEPGDQYPPGPIGSSIRNCEILKVAALQTTPNRVTLEWPTKSHHSTANVSGEALYVKGVVPLRDFEVRGFTFDCRGGTHAVGLRLDRAMNGKVTDCTFRGFSRYGLEMFGCSEIQVHKPMLGGELNGGVQLYACIDCSITSLVSTKDGLRNHANGIIRAAIQEEGLSVGTLITDFSIKHMCSGIKAECHRGTIIANGFIDDLDNRPKQLRDSEEIVGIALDLGAIDLTQASFSGPLTIANVTVTNCRCDPVVAGAGGDLTMFSVWLHDTFVLNGTGLIVANTGVSPYANIDGDDDYFMPGVGSQDCGGKITGLLIQGCEYAFGYRSSHGLEICDMEIHMSPFGANGIPPVIGLWFNEAVPTGVAFRNCVIQGGIYFGPNFVPDYHEIQLENVSFDGERFTGPLLLVKNTTGGVRTQGDVVVLDPAATTLTREVDLAGSDGAARACVVAMPAVNTIANNAPMFVAMCNTYCDRVKVNGVVQVGDVLETKSGVVQAKVAGASPVPGRIVGKAITDKPGAGDGYVRMMTA